MFNRIRIRKHERGLWFRRGDFHGLLEPGDHTVGRFLGIDEVEIVNTLEVRFEHELLDVMLEDDALRKALTVVDLVDDERAFVWKDGRLAYILGPGRYAFWNEPYELEVEVHSATAVRFEHPRIEAILKHPTAGTFLQAVHGEIAERVLFFHDGRLIDTLDGGVAVFWKLTARVDWKVVDLSEQIADITGQDIMTRDKVTLRMNLLVTYRVADAAKAVTAVEDYQQALHRAAQLALRATVGGRTLDELLADKDAVGAEVFDAISGRAESFGLAVENVGIRDVILPGDMKAILNQVIEAEKQAEANLIRRREETAAARSQANTARLLADNPALARMKELEVIQEILAGANATFVFGQSDLVNQVKNLTATDDRRDNGRRE